MKRSLLTKYLLCALTALGFALAGTAFGQGVTSSTISGTITDTAGKPVTGATVTAFYEPTNTTATTTTNSSGHYSFPGLRVGGPYKLNVSAGGFKTKTIEDIQLELSQIFQGDV